MSCRSAASLLLLTALACVAGTEPKAKPEEYPVHAEAGGVSLGAEFMVRSFYGEGSMFIAKDYLVVEVAVYPPRFGKLTVANSQFTLRVNGKKRALLAQAPGFVAASLKYPDWERRPTLVAGGGMGDSGVIIGGQRPVERFPGDPRPAQTRLPPTRRVPDPDNPAGVEQSEEPRADEVLLKTVLPEGETGGPVSGYLYFPYKKKMKSVRSLELLYRNSESAASLRLR